MQLNRIPHRQIDKKKYDACITQARNGTLYASSWYLDIAAPEWQLLATPDYSFVMPLPLKRKYGLPYILPPLFCQQLGLFSPEKITQNLLNDFLKKIPTVYCLLQLNAGNLFERKDFQLRLNYLLDISPNYKEIKNRYHGNTSRNLKKTAKNRLEIDQTPSLENLLEILAKHSNHYTGQAFETVEKLVKEADIRNQLRIRCVRKEETGEILAGVFFFGWKNRFYYLLPVSSPEGKKLHAMRFLIDRFIAELAGNNYIIDFEGSTNPSVAQFYQNFGAVAEIYPVYRSVVPPFNWVKK
jgi:hypothetical protein